jgi:UDP-glucose 4-epimerase
MKVLVTGGLGFIGSHTIVELLNNNIEVVCIDNLTNSIEEIKSRITQITNKNFSFYNIDVTDYKALAKVFHEQNNINSVIHFAAYKSVSESVVKSLDYYHNNITGLLNILKLANEYNSNIVFSSSCTVYGEPKLLPITEDSELVKPTSPYGNTKKIC